MDKNIEIIKKLEEALKHMLYIFDKKYVKGQVGYLPCEEARQALIKSKEVIK